MTNSRHPARRHLVWLAVAFMALAAGLVAGSLAFGDRPVPGSGDSALRSEVGALNARLAAADEFANRMSGRIVRDALTGKAVLLVRTPDAQDADVEAIGRIVGQAGGQVSGTLALTQEFVDANSAEKLRSVVNSPILPAGARLDAALSDPGAQAGDLLGITLLARPESATVVDPSARDTVLTALRDTGFLGPGPASPAGPADAVVVITGGALPEDAGNQGLTVARFAAALARHGAAGVLAGRDGSAGGVAAVAVARADPELSAALATVDDIGTGAGRITAVLDLQGGGGQ